MSKLLYYLKATRPRTLLLALSSIFIGITLPFADYTNYTIDWKLVVLLFLTASFLQILSNVANELGDFRMGTDSTPDRVGPHYSLASGKLEEKDFKIMIILYMILSAVCGAAAIWVAFGTFWDLGAFIFLLGGFVAIKAATQYSLGIDNYGRRGLGDFYDFLFFGLVAVIGSYLLCAKELPGWYIILPAVAVGCFNTAVLNINNIRDMKSDEDTRNTIPVRFGEKKAKIYHVALQVIGWLAMLGFSAVIAHRFEIHSFLNYLYVLSLPLFIWGAVQVCRHDSSSLDRYLPLMVVSTAFFCILAGLGYVLL